MVFLDRKDPSVISFFKKKSYSFGSPINDLMDLWQDQNGECYLCGDKLEFSSKTHIDHVVPRKKMGSDSLDNYKFCCSKCNYAKREISYRDFLILCIKISNNCHDEIDKPTKMKIIEKRWDREKEAQRNKDLTSNRKIKSGNKDIDVVLIKRNKKIKYQNQLDSEIYVDKSGINKPEIYTDGLGI